MASVETEQHLARQKIAALEKRVAWLKRRIDEASAIGRDLSFDKQERAALLWALEIVKLHVFGEVEP